MVCLSGSGGAVDYTAQLATALADRADVEVRVLAPDTAEVAASIPSELLATHAEATTKGRKLAHIVRTLRGFDPDVVHLPFYGPVNEVLLTPLLAALGPPLVGTLHDPAPHSGLETRVLGVDVETAGRRFGTRFLDRIVVHGEYCRDRAVELGYDAGKLVSIPHGVYDKFSSADVETEADTLVFFGYVRPNKGYDRIPALLDRVEEHVPGVTAVVAGSPDWNDTADEAALRSTLDALERDDRVELHVRYIDDEEVGAFFERATAVVLPYRDTTMSGVAMIAYHFEKPLVATDAGEVGPMVRTDGTGLLADPESVDDLADSVVRMLESESTRERCAANARAAKSKYTWDSIAARTVGVYEAVADD